MTIRYQALWMALVYKTDLITIHGTHGIFRIQAHIWAVAASWAREGNGTPLQYSCLENSMEGGDWWAAVRGVAKSWTWPSHFTFTVHFHALEKETGTHSSALAWRVPGTGEPGGLPSMGSCRVGHDWSDLAAAAARYTSADLLQESFKTLQSDRAFTHLFIHFVWKEKWPKVCVCVHTYVCIHGAWQQRVGGSQNSMLSPTIPHCLPCAYAIPCPVIFHSLQPFGL